MELYIISLLTFIFAMAAFVSISKSFSMRRKLDEVKIQYAISSQEEIRLKDSVHNLEQENKNLRERVAQAETRIAMLQEHLAKTEGEKSEAIALRQKAEHNYYEARNEIGRANQKVEENEKRMYDLEKQRQQAFKDAKEAMFETGKEVFNKEATEVTKNTYEQLSKIIEKVGSLSSNVESHDKGINLLFKSMSSPTAVGQFSEVGLSNILKEYGLLEGQDYIIQYSAGAGEGAKRPDAVLFIRDNVFIIDSKASKFFLEFAEAEGTAQEQEVLENIKRSMNKHLNELSAKGYREAVLDEIKKNNAGFEIGHIQTIMFLCNEAHVNKIAQADPEFIRKAIAKDIVISGPTGLQGLLAFARYSVERQKQDKNREALTKEITSLLGSISTVLLHVERVGSGIKSSAKHYENLVSSINSNLLSKAKKINKLGIPLPSNKSLSSKLESFEIITHSQQLIEAEVVTEDESSSGENIKTLELVLE